MTHVKGGVEKEDWEWSKETEGVGSGKWMERKVDWLVTFKEEIDIGVAGGK